LGANLGANFEVMNQTGLPLRKNPNVRLTTGVVGFGLTLPPEIVPAVGISATNAASPRRDRR
jgi:hypothetical protein